MPEFEKARVNSEQSNEKETILFFFLPHTPFPACPPALLVVPELLGRDLSDWTLVRAYGGPRPRCRRV